MLLLSEEKLIWSPVVANSRMNRERAASGINSYEQEFRFRPQDYLETIIREHGHASWLDLCCGQAKALLQTARHFEEKGGQENVTLEGIDLLDMFQPVEPSIRCLTLTQQSIVSWRPERSYDLITCVHGLHYIGNKLQVIAIALGALSDHGLFVANMDPANTIIDDSPSASYLKKCFKEMQVQYDGRRKILKKTGPVNADFNLTYIGADDSSGPNYTGQEAVTSYYSRRP